MSKYILLLNWTEQGIRNVKDSAKRYDAAKEAARSVGATLETIYMTFGTYDLVGILDAPSDEAAARFVLKTTQAGNVKATTLKAFAEADYRKLVESV
jgi:uncharacterized protein with GYD domain